MAASKTLLAIAALVVGLQSSVTFAHEKMENTEKADMPECTALMKPDASKMEMKDSKMEMKDSKMEMKDSMMQAMKKKCQAEMNHGSDQVPQTDKDSSSAKEDHSGEH